MLSISTVFVYQNVGMRFAIYNMALDTLVINVCLFFIM